MRPRPASHRDGPATVIVACATHRHRRELPRLAPQHRFFWHDHASDALEDIVASRRGRIIPADPEAEIERLIGRARVTNATAIISTDDYPGSTLAAAVAERLGWPGTAPHVNLLCQHKYHARLAQRRIAPDAVPRFEVVADVNRLLSEQMPDGCSYRYGIVNVGGASREAAIARTSRIERQLSVHARRRRRVDGITSRMASRTAQTLVQSWQHFIRIIPC